MVVVMMMVVMVVRENMPDDAANDPMMVMMVVVVHAGNLHVAGQPADRRALALLRRRRIGRPQRRDGVRNRIEQVGK